MDLLSSYGGDYELEYRHITKLYKNHPEYFSAEFTELGKLKRVGSGGFGTVYRSVYHGDVVAVKRLYADTPRVYKYLVREIRNLRYLDHPNILKFYAVCHHNFRELYLITDYVDGGSLDKVLKKIKGNYNLIVDILIYVARGMSYLAEIGMLHRDLKLGNILVSKDFLTVKLCDFGLSRFTNEDDNEFKNSEKKAKNSESKSEKASEAKSEEKTPKLEGGQKPKPARPMLQDNMRKMTVVGTIQYMAPELGLGRGGKIDSKMDVYSYGVMIAELLGAPPKRKEAFDIGHFEKKRDKKAPHELVELVHLCAQDNSRSRPSFREIIRMLENTRRTLFPNAAPLVAEVPRSNPKKKRNPGEDISLIQSAPDAIQVKPDGQVEGGPPPDPAPPPPIPAPLPPIAEESRMIARRRSSSVGDVFSDLPPVQGTTRKRGLVVYFNPGDIPKLATPPPESPPKSPE